MAYGLALIADDGAVLGTSAGLPDELLQWLRTASAMAVLTTHGSEWTVISVPGWEIRSEIFAAGSPCRFAVVFRVIDYDNNEQLRQQLTQMEKMAAVGQLAAGVAHEINNPVGFVSANLNSLREYADDLLKLLDLNDILSQHPTADATLVSAIQTHKNQMDYLYLRDDLLNLISESLDGLSRVKHIVQALKDFSRQDPGVFELVDIHRCIDSTLAVVNNELKYKANIVKEYGEVGMIECIPQRLNQVVMNLLVNAGHAIETRGTITIRTGAADDGIFIEIEDTGCGISEDNLRRIFEPFFTTKPVGVGTGLGLSVSFGIVQQHNGKFDVRSQLGVGTCFRIWLPTRHEVEHADQCEVSA